MCNLLVYQESCEIFSHSTLYTPQKIFSINTSGATLATLDFVLWVKRERKTGASLISRGIFRMENKGGKSLQICFVAYTDIGCIRSNMGVSYEDSCKRKNIWTRV